MNIRLLLQLVLLALMVVMITSVLHKGDSDRNPFGAYQVPADVNIRCVSDYASSIVRVEGNVFVVPIRKHNGFMNAPLTCEQYLRESL